MFDVRAYNGAGRELQIVRADPSQWNIAGHDGSVRLTYKVFGKIVDGTYLAIDTSHAHMNMPATLMRARRLDSRPVRVTFVPPAGQSGNRRRNCSRPRIRGRSRRPTCSI